MNIKDLPPAIQKELLLIDKYKKTIMSYEKESWFANEIQKMFPELIKTVSIGYAPSHVQGVLITTKDLDSFDGIENVFKHLRNGGYHLKAKPEDYPEFKRRTWNFGRIKVMAFLSYAENAKCKYVKVGVKEEPIYELKCD